MTSDVNVLQLLSQIQDNRARVNGARVWDQGGNLRSGKGSFVYLERFEMGY